MRFSNEFYFDKAAGITKDRLQTDIALENYTEGLFIIILSDKEEDSLEAIDLKHFKDPAYLKYNDTSNFRVVGTAMTKERANILFAKIVEDIYRRTGTYNIKEFFTFD